MTPLVGKLYRLRRVSTWREGREVTYTFIPDGNGDFCYDALPAHEIVMVVNSRPQNIGLAYGCGRIEVITILYGEQTHLVCPDYLVEMD